MSNVLDLLCAPWAIKAEYLERIQAIYAGHVRGERVNLQELEARRGEPLAGPARGGYELRNGVAILRAVGPISQRMSLMADVSGGTSTELLRRDIKAATADPKVKAMVLVMDSPGGAVAGTPGAAAALFAARQVKPTATLVDEMAASAGYWIGSAAEHVYMGSPVAMAGSIGVRAVHRDSSKAEEAAGVKFTEVVAGKYKDALSPHAPLSESGREILQAQVDSLYKIFVDNVSTHRSVSAEQVLASMADAREFIGQQAIDAGLADGFHSMDSLVAEMADRAKWRPIAMSPQGAKMRTNPATTGPPDAAQLPPVPFSMTMPEQVAQWAAENPEAAAALRAEGAASERAKFQGELDAAVAAARVEGGKAEAARAAEVRAQLLPGHEALIERLAADGVTTGPQAAMAVNAAERELRTAAGSARDHAAQKPVPHVASDDSASAPAAPDPQADYMLAQSIASRALVIQRECAERGEPISSVVAVQRAQLEQTGAIK